MKSMLLAVHLALVPLAATSAATMSAAPPPSPATGAPTSEHAWAMREILFDIQEMAGKPASVTDAELSSLLPWNPNDALIAFAATQLGRNGTGRDVAVADQYVALIQAGSVELFAANATISKALAENIRNPRAHEAAAMILGAFALQEAAVTFTDHRWAMNRMTAHLAVAGALRANAAMSEDGQLARAILAALANRQAEALETIARLGDPQGDSPKSAWQRALMMRVTQDWQVLKTPATATRREKLEYFRARRITLHGRSAVELELLREPSAADFARIVHLSSTNVEDGNQFVADSVVRELAELGTLYQRSFKRPMTPPLPDAINDRAGRLMSSGTPVVLPWGAWAEFSQRHIAMAVAETDRHYRRVLALPDQADELNEAIDSVLPKMRLFSLASINRGVGEDANDYDGSYLAEAAAVVTATPELVTAAQWNKLELMARAALTPSSVPNPRGWFIEPSNDAFRRR